MRLGGLFGRGCPDLPGGDYDAESFHPRDPAADRVRRRAMDRRAVDHAHKDGGIEGDPADRLDDRQGGRVEGIRPTSPDDAVASRVGHGQEAPTDER